MINMIEIDGTRIEYLDEGKGRPIIFLPGIGGNFQSWNKIINRLKSNYHIYSFSFPIYGSQNPSGEVYTVDTLHNFLDKIITHFKIEKPIIVGFSLGGIATATYISRHANSVVKEILVSTPFFDQKRKKVPLTWEIAIDITLKSKEVREITRYFTKNDKLIKILAQLFFPSEISRNKSKFNIDSFVRHAPVKSIALCYKDVLNANFEKDLEKINVPTLFIYGHDDTPIKKCGGTKLYGKVLNSKILSHPGSHFLYNEYPREITEMIVDFIEKDLEK